VALGLRWFMALDLTAAVSLPQLDLNEMKRPQDALLDMLP
jgi:hypothetical protein